MPGAAEPPAARALAELYATAAERSVLTPLLGIEREIAAGLRPGLEHAVAHARLSWWREECARAAAGRPQHPLTRALAASAPPGSGALAGLSGLTDAATWDLAQATFETRRELEGYCARWGQAMIEPLGRLARVPTAALGAPLRELELLLALVPEARGGKLRLPLDELAGAHVTPASLTRPPLPAALSMLLRERHQALRRTLVAAAGALPGAGLRGLLVWVRLTCLYSERAERALPQAAASGDHQRALDGWRAWRMARRVTAGRPVPRNVD
jgi:15-cis-phytoene synthase